MISLYEIKPQFQRALWPICQCLANCSVTPNQVTITACALSLLGGGLLWFSQSQPVFLLAMPALLLVRMGLNALDGMLAREFNQASPLGEILNEVSDVVSDTALYLPLIVLFAANPPVIPLIALFAVLSCLTEFCGVLARARIGQRRYDGPMGKSDRAFFISLLALALYFRPDWIQQWGVAIFLTLNILLAWSAFNRLRAILNARKEAEHA